MGMRKSGHTGRNGTHRTEQSTVGVKSGYPRLESGAIGVAPSAAKAVDNPSGLSPAEGRRPSRYPTPHALPVRDHPARLCGQLYRGDQTSFGHVGHTEPVEEVAIRV
jgi:hypothetical protein